MRTAKMAFDVPVFDSLPVNMAEMLLELRLFDEDVFNRAMEYRWRFTSNAYSIGSLFSWSITSEGLGYWCDKNDKFNLHIAQKYGSSFYFRGGHR